MLKWKDISERKENDYIPLYFNVDDFRYNYIYRIPNDIGADLFIPKKHQDKIHNIFIQIKHGETLLGYEDKAGSNKFACQTIRARIFLKQDKGSKSVSMKNLGEMNFPMNTMFIPLEDGVKLSKETHKIE